ncbi:hypothetical protein LG284_05435 [Citricoccus nitrophenolicus]
MGFDWEEVLGVEGEDDLQKAYDQTTTDALYQDHPRSVPPGCPVDPGDDEIDLPFEEE